MGQVSGGGHYFGVGALVGELVGGQDGGDHGIDMIGIGGIGAMKDQVIGQVVGMASQGKDPVADQVDQVMVDRAIDLAVVDQVMVDQAVDRVVVDLVAVDRVMSDQVAGQAVV